MIESFLNFCLIFWPSASSPLGAHWQHTCLSQLLPNFLAARFLPAWCPLASYMPFSITPQICRLPGSSPLCAHKSNQNWCPVPPRFLPAQKSASFGTFKESKSTCLSTGARICPYISQIRPKKAILGSFKNPPSCRERALAGKRRCLPPKFFQNLTGYRACSVRTLPVSSTTQSQAGYVTLIIRA